MKILKTCAVAGAVSSLPVAGHAAVITVPVNETINAGQSLDLTISPTLGGAAINVNGRPDFTFTTGSAPVGTGTIAVNSVTGSNGSQFVADINGNPVNVSGMTVGSSDTFGSSAGEISDFFGGGNFDKKGATGYLGFEVPVTPTTYDYGWIELNSYTGYFGQSLTIDAYAYDDSGAPITAPAAVPEPSSLALFALGAAGVETLRRRKAKSRS